MKIAPTSTTRICPVCGKDVPVDAPKGICPECLVGQVTRKAVISPGPGAAADEARHFGDYELLGELAAGGMGTVYCARQARLNRIVALKMIRSGRLASTTEVQRFHAEAEAAANLAHPNIVPIYEFGEQQGQHYFTMKLIEGGHLGELSGAQCERGSRWLRRAARLIATLCRAVHHAHQHGVLHRDIKPTNILIDEAGEPHLTDFGLAKLAHKESTLTATDAIIGTPHYMAPEQAGGKARQVTTATDIFSLGAILYELAGGKPPFEGESAIEVLTRVRSSEPASLRKLNPAVNRDLETICLKCLEKEPQRRYASAELLAADLERWLAGEPIAARPITVTERAGKWARRNPGLSGLSGVAALMLVAGVIGICVQWRRAQANAAESRERLVRLNVSSGVRLLDNGNHFGSLVWFAQALALDADDAHKERAHRLRVASVLRECPTLLQLWSPGEPVHAAEFSGDGQSVMAVAGQHVHLWDTLSGKPLIAPILHEGAEKLDADLSPDGLRVLTVNGGTAVIWSAKTGQPLTQIPGTNILCAAFGPEAEVVATGEDRSLTLWRLSGTSPVAQFVLPLTGSVRRLQFSPNGQRLLAWGADGRVHVCHLRKTEPSIASWKPKGGLRDAQFNFDGSRIVTAQSDGTAQVWDSATAQSITSFEKEGTWLTGAAFSRDGRRVATTAGGHIARVWNAATGKRLASLGGHKNVVLSCAFSPSGRRIVTASFDGTARVYESDTGKALTPPLPHGGLITAAQFHPDGQRVLTASADGTVKVWSIWPRTGFTVPWHDESAQIVNISARGERLILQDASHRMQVIDTRIWKPVSAQMAVARTKMAWLHEDQSRMLVAYRADDAGFVVELWQPATGQRLTTVTLRAGANDWIMASDDCSRIAVVRGRTVEVFDSATARPTFSEPHRSSDTIKRVQFSPDAARLLVAAGNAVVVLEAERGVTVAGPLRHQAPLSDAKFSRDGKWIVTACLDNLLEAREAQVWDATTGRRVSPPIRHADGIFHAAFTADGRHVITAGEDGMARLWHARNGQAASPPFRHLVAVNHASVSADGRFVATGSHDKTARIWDANTGEPLTPKIEHPSVHVFGKDAGVDRAVFVGGDRYLLTRYSSAVAYLWALPSEHRPAKDLMALAGLLSGQQLDFTGALEPLAADAMERTWTVLRRKYPSDFSWTQFNEKVPPRNDAARLSQIDLSAHYNASLSDAFNFNSSAEGAFRPGLQVVAGTEFDVRGIVQLASEEIHMSAPRPFPEAVALPIHQQFSQLHLLHSAAGFDEPGVIVARLVLHYADGDVQEIPVIAGEDLDDWRPRPAKPTRAQAVWQGELRPTRSWTPRVQLFKSSWDNPRPGLKVMRIDYISEMRRAAPFMMAITLER